LIENSQHGVFSMQYILQNQLETLKKLVTDNKVIIILGPRQCGKTTLLKKYIESLTENYLFVTGDDIETQISLYLLCVIFKIQSQV
jgi:predicted AAA+ superfamily ATPase